MPYVNARSPMRVTLRPVRSWNPRTLKHGRGRGFGAFNWRDLFLGTDYGKAIYGPDGRYQGGSQTMDLYCNTVLGSSDPVCGIRTPAEIRAQQIQELATTGASPEAQAAAVAAGDAAVKVDMTARPDAYKQQCAAANHPDLAAAIGPGATAAFFPTDTDCNPTTPWLLIGLLAGGGFLLLRGTR
jgi:hypothetical protein